MLSKTILTIEYLELNPFEQQNILLRVGYSVLSVRKLCSYKWHAIIDYIFEFANVIQGKLN